MLVKLAKTVLILSHGNAKMELVFSMLPDIIAKKRTSLGCHTVKSLVVTIPLFAVKNLTSAKFSINKALLKQDTTAHATYKKRLMKQKKCEELEKQKEREILLLDSFKEESKACWTSRKCFS